VQNLAGLAIYWGKWATYNEDGFTYYSFDLVPI